MLDFQLEEEAIQVAEENELPPPPPQPDEPQPWPQHAPVDVPINEKVNSESEGVRYIEYFPKENLAGATYGRCKPLYASLDEEQKRVGHSRWAPFEDEEEWQLAEWLIHNVGQKQTDNFLKLPIVSFILLIS